MLAELKIINEIVVKNAFFAILYNNGIVEIVWDKSVTLIEPHHLIKIKQVLFELGDGKKMPIYFSTPAFLHISDEAKKLAATEENSIYTLANAVLIRNLAQRLIFNFFMNIYRPTTPVKSFSTKEEAFTWLKKIEETVLQS